uniref:Uncharacterized protein n=1 Tax=Anopheles farauti TaxID=69004 RepID=A0A182QM61_9DIPT
MDAPRKQRNPKYLIVDEDQKNDTLEPNLHDMIVREEDVIEDQEEFHIEFDDSLSESQIESTMSDGLAENLQEQSQDVYLEEIRQQCNVTEEKRKRKNSVYPNGQLRVKDDDQIYEAEGGCPTYEEEIIPTPNPWMDRKDSVIR